MVHFVLYFTHKVF